MDKPIIHLINMPIYGGVADLQWSEGQQLYKATNGELFQPDQVVAGSFRVIAIKPVPEGYMGWFGYGSARCTNGPLDKQEVTILHRAERNDIFKALSN